MSAGICKCIEKQKPFKIDEGIYYCSNCGCGLNEVDTKDAMWKESRNMPLEPTKGKFMRKAKKPYWKKGKLRML